MTGPRITPPPWSASLAWMGTLAALGICLYFRIQGPAVYAVFIAVYIACCGIYKITRR